MEKKKSVLKLPLKRKCIVWTAPGGQTDPQKDTKKRRRLTTTSQLAKYLERFGGRRFRYSMLRHSRERRYAGFSFFFCNAIFTLDVTTHTGDIALIRILFR